MGMGIYIECDNKDIKEDLFVSGKHFGMEMDAVSALAEELGLPRVEFFISCSVEEQVAFLKGELDAKDDELDLSNLKENWFSPERGIDYFNKLIESPGKMYMNEEKTKNIVEDMKEYVLVLEIIKSKGAKFHLASEI